MCIIKSFVFSKHAAQQIKSVARVEHILGFSYQFQMLHQVGDSGLGIFSAGGQALCQVKVSL